MRASENRSHRRSFVEELIVQGSRIVTEFSNSLAVVIGIDQYGSGINSLQTAVSDVEAIAQSLQQDHGYDVLSFVDQQATLSVLQYLITTLLPRRVKPESQLLFYFAGHGIALNGEEGPEGYLIPQDAKAGDTGSYLAMPKLQAALSALPCRHFLGILDCCFAGAFRWSSTRDIGYESGPIYQERYNRFVQDPAWQILTSAAHDQTALDAFSLTGHRGQVGGQVGAHSPFAAALIEALGGKADAYPPAKGHRPAGDGVITATELYLYLRDRVEIATTARALRQTPGLHSLKKHDKGEYIFRVPGHPLNLPAAPNLNESANPYRGLQAFEAEHSALFFGRTQLVEQLKDFVTAHPLTVVLGASGCGKSSLVKAGLVPLLQQQSTQSWQVLPTIRPGEHPLEALNQALAQAGLPAVGRLDSDAEASDKADSDKTLVQSVAAWVTRFPNCPLLIFIDQSEEVITLCASERERYSFFQQILTAVDTYREQLRVVISLRSDFEPQVRDSGLKFAPEALRQKGKAELKNRWQKGRFLVPAMTRAELREAIEKPAEARVMYFEPYTLVEQLIDEVANMPGALPLLSFALSELYLKYLKRQQTAAYSGSIENRTLTQSDYEALGGVVYALTQRATWEYETLVTQEACYEQTVKNVMLRMVATGGEMARRKVPEAELLYPEPEGSRVKTVLDNFLSARLITTGTDANDEVYLEPAHDALVRGWDKLLIWKSEAEEKLLLQRRVTQAANEWKQAKGSHHQPQVRWKVRRKTPQKADTFLWNTSPYLNVLTEMLQAHDHGFNRVETAFIQQSLRLKQQQLRRRKGITLTVTSAIAAAAIFSTVQAVIAQLNISTALRRSSSANFASNRYQFDALIDGLVAANRLSAFPGNRFMHTTQAETQTALTVPLFWTRELNRITHHSDAVQSVDYSPNGELFVTGGYDGAVIVSHADGRLFKRFGDSDNGIMSVHFSPDGQTVAAARIGGDVELWTIKDGSRRVIKTNEAAIYTVRFSPDGQHLLTGGPNNSAKLWTRRGDFVQTVGSYSEPIRSAEFIVDDSQNDRQETARIIIASEDGTVAFWQLEGADSHLLSSHNNDSALTTVDVSPNGQLIAIASLNNTVTLWNVAGNLLETLQHSQEIWSVAFSADSRSLATGSAEGEITLWTSKGQRLDSWAAHVGPINSLDFSPDGTTLMTAGNDYITKVWRLQREWMQALEGHAGSVESVQFSADSNTVVSGSETGELWLWDAAGGSPALKQTVASTIYDLSLSPNKEKIALAKGDGDIQILSEEGDSLENIEAHSEEVRSVSFSPDGNSLASASNDGTVKLWDLEGVKGNKPPVSFEGHGGRVLSVNFSPDGQRLVTAGDDAIVRVFSVEGTLIEAFEGHEILAREAVFSPDGQLIASASSDRTIKLWNPETGKVTTLEGAAGHKTAVTAVSFSPDGEMIASASTDHTVKLWHRDGRLITTLLGHTSYVNAVAFSPDGKQLISADYQGKMLVWQVAGISLAQAIEKGCAQVKDYISSGPPQDLRGLKKICKPEADATTAR